MRLLTYYADHQLRLGVKTDRGVVDVLQAAEHFSDLNIPKSIEAVVADEESISVLSEIVDRVSTNGDATFLEENNLTLGPCVPNPRKIICVGQNYKSHVDEYTIGAFDTPVLFSKYNNTIAGHGQDIEIPHVSEQIDYEAELAVVIGKVAHGVPEAKALEYVFGYCNANDLSARDLQFRTVQWLLGKSPDGFCPVGPYLVTSDEIKDPNQLEIRCYLNGELRQSSNTKFMIFNIAFLVSYISQYITLEPGDILLTGTPEGTILGYPKDKQVWIKDGDVVTVEVEGLGRLTNRLISQH